MLNLCKLDLYKIMAKQNPELHCVIYIALTFYLFWFYLYIETHILLCMHKYVRMVSS